MMYEELPSHLEGPEDFGTVITIARPGPRELPEATGSYIDDNGGYEEDSKIEPVAETPVAAKELSEDDQVETARDEVSEKRVAKYTAWILFGGDRRPNIKAGYMNEAELAIQGLQGVFLKDDAKARLGNLEERLEGYRARKQPKKKNAGALNTGRKPVNVVLDPERDLSWQKQAACRGVGPEYFFPLKEEDAQYAICKFCAGCAVSSECLSQGVDEWAEKSVRGGVYLTVDNLKVLKKRSRK